MESISLEEAISGNIVKYLHTDDLMNRDIASLDRIISKYFNQNNNNLSDEKQVIDFLFRCLDKKGEDASILFAHTINSSYRHYIIIRLYKEYKGKFDFNLINSSLFLSSFEIIFIILILLAFSIILTISLIIVSTAFYYDHKNSNEQIKERNDKINDLINGTKRYERETISINEKYEKELQFTKSFYSQKIENLTKDLNEKEPKVKKGKESYELEFHFKKCVDENRYYNLTNELFKFITKSITKNLSIHDQKLSQYFNNSVLNISITNKFDNPDIRLEIIVDDLIQRYFQQSFDYCANLISDSIENNINNKNANELVELSRMDFIKPIEDNICEIFINKLNDVFENVSNIFPQKLERYSFNLRSKIQSSLDGAFKTRYKQIIKLTKKDSNDAEKVQNFIKLIRLPHQKQITTYAFGRNRTFNLDEKGNIIIPITYKYIEKSKNFKNGAIFDRNPNKKLPIDVTYDFAKMAIHTNITTINSIVNQTKTSYFWFIGKNIETHRCEQKLTIEIGGDFIFKNLRSQIYILRSPQIEIEQDETINKSEETDVPYMIPITMR